MIQNKIQANIWKFTIHSITNKRTYMTFLTIFLLTMPNATAKTIGVFVAVGQIIGFLFEIPSGYISDKIGYKNALLLARFLLVLSTLCYVLANSIPWFFIGTTFFAIGMSFSSGTGSALMYDSLKKIGKDNQYSYIMGKIKSFGFAVPIIFILLLPMIAETSFKLAFLIALIIDIIGFIAVSLMVNPNDKLKTEKVNFSNFKRVIKKWFKVGWVRYILITTLIFGIVFGATVGFKNPYQEMLGFSLTALGFLWGIARLLVSILLLFNGWIYKTFSYKQFLIIKTLVYSLCFLGIGLISNMYIVASIFIIQNIFMWGLSSASEQYALNFIKKQQSKATLLSINRLIQNIFATTFGLTMGFLVSGYSYSFAYLIMGIILAFIAITTVFFIKNIKLPISSKLNLVIEE